MRLLWFLLYFQPYIVFLSCFWSKWLEKKLQGRPDLLPTQPSWKDLGRKERQVAVVNFTATDRSNSSVDKDHTPTNRLRQDKGTSHSLGTANGDHSHLDSIETDTLKAPHFLQSPSTHFSQTRSNQVFSLAHCFPPLLVPPQFPLLIADVSPALHTVPCI